MYLLKCREAPRIKPDNQLASEARTKDFYIQAATSTLNDASRISPSYPPLFLARGVLYLLRSSLQSSKSGSASQISAERIETLKQADKCFGDALRASGHKNIMAFMGKARVQYSLGKYGEALKLYQGVLEKAPDVIDPDPRIGIGCCFWQLGHKDDAQRAWERAMELNPKSKIALILLGLYNFHRSSQYSTSDPNFAEPYRKAITQYTVPAFKMDNKLPLTCATLGGYYMMKRMMDKVESLARRAIELTDVNAIASDGWYLLARKEHSNDDIAKAYDYYSKSDQARGGDERGYIPAKFGSAQIRVLMQDYDGAKFRLEKIVQQAKIPEAQTLLGTLYAEDVFSAQSAKSKEEKSNEMKKALTYLEAVRLAWADPKKNLSADSSVLLNLARLYEIDHPDKSLKCLEQVEQMEIDDIPDEDKPQGIDDEAEYNAALRESLPPQLLNNMGCFHYQSEKYGRARELFQTALNACVKAGDKDQSIDTDALVTTISYNLARTYEAEGMPNEAKQVYEGLLDRHSDYTDAVTRLAYIALRQSPGDEGPKAIQKLYREEPSNLEVRALYGWYLSKAKKRTPNFGEDQEQRHYKHTLQSFDKHDRYSLTGMGNVYLTIAREMRRDTEQDKDKRRNMYSKAVEIFDKALQLDPRNAYAAQGIAIALVEDKKDYATALQIFTKVRETMKEASVFINLGHTYCEVKQYARAIENYEAALSKDRARDPQILACLGRVWLLRGKHDKNIKAMKTSLEYSQRALEVAPEQVHFKFNVAFVQFQIAQLVINLQESQRTLEEVEAASTGLDQAIESFSAIAQSPNPPFPKHDIEQRANMGRNTMRRQIERTLQQQREYEQKNADRLKQARGVREAEMKKREEEKRKAEEAKAEERRKVAEQRQKMEERDREYIERRKEEEKRRQEFVAQDEVRKGERGKGRRGGKRKKKGDASDSDTEGGDTDAGARRSRQRSAMTSATPDTQDERPRQKKRKLERKSKIASKFKSDEVIVDSGSEDNADVAGGSGKAGIGSDQEQSAARPRKAARIIDDDDDEDEDAGVTKPTGRAASDEDEEMVEAPAENGGNAGGESESE
ncbi:tetratricopeptide repeat protein 1 [Mytilinidion resinicola]|uniref:Tetratricopeptide repeat protein 1 n=1 Tax=Mytilinidion resinicola TaxID=574789 RepID=A0A6A6YR35_9PEZI|nr:tetratricopeptide repeat protein 1 [Mytilinidion resinicola]KAF2810979.1 tetratricopeptide repeat protein 1 [Mytilinidion resinicola]